ncbi:MAG: CPBP family intramembrane metalloprotease [Candidatus Poribacteria bacterium]|nr:CPBP family intramembrane metalloprotease [Candidatus Poribacteria bacterium]
MGNETPRGHQPVLLGILVEGGLAGVALLLGKLVSQPPLASIYWDKADLLVGIVSALPMLGAFWFFLRWPVGSLVELRRFLMEFVRPLFGRCTLLELSVISLLAGVGEEMLFRGVLQGALSRWFGPVVGLAVASIFFGLAHFMSPTYAVVASLMGAYLGGVWQSTDNLLTPIVTHAVYDFLALYWLLKSEEADRSGFHQ